MSIGFTFFLLFLKPLFVKMLTHVPYHLTVPEFSNEDGLNIVN